MRELFKKYKYFLWILYVPFYFISFVWLEHREVTDIHIIHFFLDDKIPFCEYFILPYYIWFAYIFVSVAYFILWDREEFKKLAWFLSLGMTLFLIVSWLYPNGLNLRPTEFAHDNFCVDLCKKIYSTDTPTNVLPSIHVYNSLCVCIAFSRSKIGKKHKSVAILSWILSLLISASTLFVKQHSVVDVFSAVCMVIGFYLAVYVLPELVKKQKEAKKATPVLEGEAPLQNDI